jgi:GNAT superfamily N-acetyltransferase
VSLFELRRAIRHLLNERHVADAMAAYYAFYHPDSRTSLVTYPPGAGRASGYVCLSRTGIDLFRPLVTLRLPLDSDTGQPDPAATADLIHQAIPAGSSLFLSGPAAYHPLISALFAIDLDTRLKVYTLREADFEPVINVLVTQEADVNGLPHFTIRQNPAGGPTGRGELLASASANWQSPHFTEISVRTHQSHRRQGFGRSVVAALAQEVLRSGRTPVYVLSEDNTASSQLAESVGFADTGHRQFMIQGTLKTRP